MLTLFANILALAVAFYVAFYYIQYDTNPKMYILEKYNKFVIKMYDKIFDLMIPNEDLRIDSINQLRDILYYTSYYEFDKYFKNHTHLYEYQISNYSIIDLKFHKWEQPEKKIDHVDQFIHSELDEIIHENLLDSIKKLNARFFYHLAHEMNFIDKKKGSSIALGNVFFQSLLSSKLYEEFHPENNDVFSILLTKFQNINKKYKCIQIKSDICPEGYFQKMNSKHIIMKNNYFSNQMIKCCNM